LQFNTSLIVKNNSMLHKTLSILTLFLIGFGIWYGCEPAERSADEKSKEDIIEASLEEILDDPAEFENKDVHFTGIVDHYCRAGGDKMWIIEPATGLMVHVMLEDFADRFDISSEGKQIEIEGKVAVTETGMEDIHEGCTEFEVFETMNAKGMQTEKNIIVELKNWEFL